MNTKISTQLTDKGASAVIADNVVQATLYWQTSVDLDLYCYYKMKGAPIQKKGFMSKLFGGENSSSSSGMGRINYNSKGNLHNSPFIQLDKDSGVGDKVDGGVANEENIHFGDLSKLDYALIVANIYSKNTNFAQYNGKVTVHCASQEIVVPLSETKRGSWCVVALIDNTSGHPRLVNINKTMTSEPQLSSFI